MAVTTKPRKSATTPAERRTDASEAQILARLRKSKRGKTSIELHTTTIKLDAMAQDGKVKRLGDRKTGKRGRPPVEWAIGPNAQS